MSHLTSLAVEISDLKFLRLDTPKTHLLFTVGDTKVRAFDAPHSGIRLENLDTDGDWQPAGTVYGENTAHLIAAAAESIRSLQSPGEPAYTEEIDFLAALTAVIADIPSSTETIEDEVVLTVLSDAPEADVMVLLDYDDENILANVVSGFTIDDETVSPIELGLRELVTLPGNDLDAIAAEIRKQLDELPELMIDVFDALDDEEDED